MSAITGVVALLGLAVGVGFGHWIRSAYGWSATVITLLLLAVLVPWFVHHGHLLNALRFGAIQSAWTHPDAFGRVHATGYAVAGVTVLLAGGLSRLSRWVLVFSPGFVFMATLLLTIPIAAGAVAEGYFILPSAVTSTFWVASMTTTGLLFGYCRTPERSASPAPDSIDPEHSGMSG